MAKYNQAMEDLLRYNAAMLPQRRSQFNKSTNHITTMDSGYVVPLVWDRVLPGDEKKIRYSGLARMATPLFPVMDEAKFDVACFYVPDRLVWEHAREFYGENKDASFNPDGEYVIPSLHPDQWAVRSDSNDISVGLHSLNDYFGFPVINSDDLDMLGDLLDDPELQLSALLHRGYHLIWNYFYRNSSVQPAEELSTGDSVTDAEWNVIKNIRLACKFPDYFTSLLKEPQAGDDVLLPLGDKAPVVSTYDMHDKSIAPLRFEHNDDQALPHFYPLSVSTAGYGSNIFSTVFDESAGTEVGDRSLHNFTPNNLWADLTNATASTINNLRAAVTIQHLLEVDNRAGKKYQQVLQAHFGVFTPDATLSQPELLGLTRTSVGMRQVLQTSSTANEESPLGSTAAFSLTNVSNEWICNKSFTEPGTLFVLGVIRPVHSYSQGIDPLLTKLHRYDHYWPVFDNLGNQPVPVTSIFCTSTGADGYDGIPYALGKTLGYQEAWTEYKIRPNRVSGLMRPDVSGTLAAWNYSSKFDRVPVLNSAFVEEDPNLIDRTIAVTGEPQFIVDNYFEYFDTKSMSVHSIPGITRL